MKPRLLLSLSVLTILAATSCGKDEEASLASLAFVTPQVEGDGADESYQVRISFTSAAEDDTWSLSYVSGVTDSRGGTIGSGTVSAAGEAVVDWSTKDLPNGYYYLTAELRASGRVALATAPGYVAVSHAQAGNSSPTVTLLSPNGGEVLTRGSASTISWRQFDADGDAMTVSLEYSSNSGSTWKSLATGLSGTSYSWTVPATVAAGASYRVRATISDGKGGASSDGSDRDFTIKLPTTWTNTVFAIVQPSCSSAACHSTGGAADAEFVSDLYTNAEGTGAYQRRDRLWARIVDGTMPPPASGYPEISTTDLAKIKEWLDTNAAQ